MVEIRQTARFKSWFAALRDVRAKARIDMRIARLAAGNAGDAKFFDGIGELRIDYGPGYRVYFRQRGQVLVILLCGGDKGSQGRDIAMARRLAEDLEDEG
ncbi:type II toxin-antitoxin system RelE/ParE family toxin [Azorhizobium doebereinerae]|uniref:type II toxin-antitoxin system RelE/ParE family toxin n=1 Tax=Azorhizobium doebereinerae TaxID=281091 RepID=UPI000411CD00|nr:type II toxin-antitoxin system RelE/ParE family toxin [Azorhizobium doebereinerae]